MDSRLWGWYSVWKDWEVSYSIGVLGAWEISKGFLGKRKEYRCRVFKNLMSFCKGHGVNARDRRASKLSSASIQGQFDSSTVASHLDFIKSDFSNPEIIL